MGATSSEGSGNGASNKLTTNQLSILANGPKIYFTGVFSVADLSASPPSSPPASASVVYFPYILEGSPSNYVVLLTTMNAGAVYISDLLEDDDGNFSGFSAIAETEGEAMYMVASVGVKPKV